MLCALSTCKARVSNNSTDLSSLHEIDAMYAHMAQWAVEHPNHRWTKSLRKRLEGLVNKESGVIDELPGGIRTPLALAQLNVVLASLKS